MILIKNNIKNNFKKLKEYNAGLVLKGWEVKLIKKKYIEIKNSFIYIKNKEVFVKNIIINNNINKINRDIKLLLNKNEILNIINIKNKLKIKIIPFNIFIEKNFLKIKIILISKDDKVL